ncbi:hypothetical protein AcV5_010005 [Taiwanofungus camphoratus]|nr:hypothetical protein AcV5_010005 [Antrodia cinnamomea]
MLARMLLETGASPDARNRYGQVPLDGAIQHNGIGAVELLMEFGADVDVADADDTTPRNFVLKCGPQVTAAMTKGLRKRNGEEAPMEEGKKCVACGKTERLKLCSKCHAAWYCSAACQRANWPMHKQTCQPYSASNAVTVKPNYVRHGKLTSKADFARAVLGIPSDLPPVRQQRHTHVPHLRPDQTKAMVIKVQVPRPIDERHAVHTLSGDLLIYNKKRDFVCSIMKSENPVGYTVITDAVRTKGVGGTKAYFPAELRNKDELAIKVGEVLAEQPF